VWIFWVYVGGSLRGEGGGRSADIFWWRNLFMTSLKKFLRARNTEKILRARDTSCARSPLCENSRFPALQAPEKTLKWYVFGTKLKLSKVWSRLLCGKWTEMLNFDIFGLMKFWQKLSFSAKMFTFWVKSCQNGQT